MSRKRTLLGYASLSLIAAGMLIVISWIGAQNPGQLTQMERITVSIFFMASCVLGILLSSKPGSLRRRREGRSAPGPAENDRPRYLAHHPDCGRFDDRVVVIGGKRYCGGCLGLASVSLLALALTMAYLLAAAQLSAVASSACSGLLGTSISRSESG